MKEGIAMKSKKLLAIFFIIAFTFAGCIPKIKATSPLVSGQVIDNITKKPISGVVVNSVIKTDKEGRFFIDKESELGVATTMGGIYTIEKTFSLTKKGYVSLVCTCSTLVNSAECSDETIMMTKVKQKKEIPFRLHVKNKNYGLSCHE